jgi:hypothetical protein
VVSVTDNTLSPAGTQQSFPVTGTSLEKLSQTIGFSPILATSYGAGPIALSAIASSGLPITYQVVSGPAVLSNGAKFLSLNGTGLVVVAARQAGSSVYTSAEVIQSFMVAQATLTVMPVSMTAVYGAIPSSFNYTVSGFVLGQSATVVTGKPAISSSASSKSGVGIYTLTASIDTLSAANYSFVFGSGTLTINKAVLTVTATNPGMTYGGLLPVITYAVKGFVNGDTQTNSVSGAPQLTTVATGKSAVGKYAISAGAGTLSAANYSFVFDNGTLTINKAVVMVDVANQSMTYGGALPATIYAVKGFVNGDTQSKSVSGAPQFTSAATGTPAAGKYTIKAEAGTLSSVNYSFTFGSGMLTVNTAVLTVAAANQSMIYGGTLPGMTYIVKGFANGDTQGNSVTGAPKLTTAATSKSAVGKYAISLGAGTFSARNYTFQYAPGSLTVNNAVLTVTAANASMTYGSAAPAMTSSITGFVNGDSSQLVVTGVATVTSAAKATSVVGTYAITVAAGSLAAKNYSFIFKAGNMTVNPAPLTVTADNLSMPSGLPLPGLTYTVSGWVNKDTSSSAASGAPALSTNAASASPAGSYTISVKLGTMKAGNYALTFVNGVLTVTSQSGGAIVRRPIASPAPLLPMIPNKARIGLLVP